MSDDQQERNVLPILNNQNHLNKNDPNISNDHLHSNGIQPETSPNQPLPPQKTNKIDVEQIKKEISIDWEQAVPLKYNKTSSETIKRHSQKEVFYVHRRNKSDNSSFDDLSPYFDKKHRNISKHIPSKRMSVDSSIHQYSLKPKDSPTDDAKSLENISKDYSPDLPTSKDKQPIENADTKGEEHPEVKEIVHKDEAGSTKKHLNISLEENLQKEAKRHRRSFSDSVQISRYQFLNILHNLNIVDQASYSNSSQNSQISDTVDSVNKSLNHDIFQVFDKNKLLVNVKELSKYRNEEDTKIDRRRFSRSLQDEDFKKIKKSFVPRTEYKDITKDDSLTRVKANVNASKSEIENPAVKCGKKKLSTSSVSVIDERSATNSAQITHSQLSIQTSKNIKPQTVQVEISSTDDDEKIRKYSAISVTEENNERIYVAVPNKDLPYIPNKKAHILKLSDYELSNILKFCNRDEVDMSFPYVHRKWNKTISCDEYWKQRYIQFITLPYIRNDILLGKYITTQRSKEEMIFKEQLCNIKKKKVKLDYRQKIKLKWKNFRKILYVLSIIVMPIIFMICVGLFTLLLGLYLEGILNQVIWNQFFVYSPLLASIVFYIITVIFLTLRETVCFTLKFYDWRHIVRFLATIGAPLPLYIGFICFGFKWILLKDIPWIISFSFPSFVMFITIFVPIVLTFLGLSIKHFIRIHSNPTELEQLIEAHIRKLDIEMYRYRNFEDESLDALDDEDETNGNVIEYTVKEEDNKNIHEKRVGRIFRNFGLDKLPLEQRNNFFQQISAIISSSKDVLDKEDQISIDRLRDSTNYDSNRLYLENNQQNHVLNQVLNKRASENKSDENLQEGHHENLIYNNNHKIKRDSSLLRKAKSNSFNFDERIDFRNSLHTNQTGIEFNNHNGNEEQPRIVSRKKKIGDNELETDKKVFNDIEMKEFSKENSDLVIPSAHVYNNEFFERAFNEEPKKNSAKDENEGEEEANVEEEEEIYQTNISNEDSRMRRLQRRKAKRDSIGFTILYTCCVVALCSVGTSLIFIPMKLDNISTFSWVFTFIPIYVFMGVLMLGLSIWVIWEIFTDLIVEQSRDTNRCFAAFGFLPIFISLPGAIGIVLLSLKLDGILPLLSFMAPFGFFAFWEFTLCGVFIVTMIGIAATKSREVSDQTANTMTYYDNTACVE